MGQYAALTGKRVEAHYRASELHLSVCGILTAETAEAVVIQERFTRNGREKTIRVEIPHTCIVRIQECPAAAEGVRMRPASAGTQI